MGAHSAKATRTAVAAGKSVVKNETLKEILAASPQNAGVADCFMIDRQRLLRSPVVISDYRSTLCCNRSPIRRRAP
jgi:hypothetical protein